MKYLVDVNVLSEATRPAPNPRVIRWLRKHQRELVLDPVILGEIRFGIGCMPAGKKRKALESWFEHGIANMEVLPWDAAVGLRWGTLLAELRRHGKNMPVKDSLIAASALHHRLTIATRNTKDFATAGVPVVNPF